MVESEDSNRWNRPVVNLNALADRDSNVDDDKEGKQ